MCHEAVGVHWWPFWLQVHVAPHWLKSMWPPHVFKCVMDVEAMDDAPEEGDGAGVHMEINEPLGELAMRVWEVEAMRRADRIGRSGSPTEVCSLYSSEAHEEETEDISPSPRLKRMIDGTQAGPSKAVPTFEEKAIDWDEYGMIPNEQHKLKKFVPEHLKMPWERGFAGAVLNQKVEILPLESLKESTRSAKSMKVEVEPAAQSQEPPKIKPSFAFKESGRMPWDRAQAEAGRHSRARSMIEADGEEVLDDIFAKKKNGTLQVRLSELRGTNHSRCRRSCATSTSIS